MEKQKEMTKDQYEEANLASMWRQKFMNAMIAKSEYTKKWQRYIDAYRGDYFKDSSRPDYKSNLVSNYIFSIVETIRPIMLDNDPKFQAMPRQPDGLPFSNDLHEAFNYEWDREDMSVKLYRELINTLVIGTSIYFLPWNSATKNVNSIPVNAFNLFPDPLATGVDDAEHLIYATYKHEGVLQKAFPAKADKLKGGGINYSELVQENDKGGSQITNQILVLEVYARDYSTEVVEDVGGLKRSVALYPGGRVLTICPELGIVLSDKPNPYKDKKFPFTLMKDYDVPGKFWGEGEVSQLLSPQTYMNELGNAVIDNAKRTANMPWIIDKNSGIGVGQITDRPGLVLRKNPGSEVRRDAPPPLPAYVQNAVADLKSDMEQISGIFDTLKGNSETGVYTAQGILALQEAGQARVRLKVKLLENALGKLATMWYSRMKQFWKEDRWMRITRTDGTYDMKMFTKNILDYDYDIKITAGSTMAVNRGAMLDLMVRLAQTQMPDGQPLVDREAVVTYLPDEVKSTLMQRMQGNQQGLDQLAQQMEQQAQENQARDEQTMQMVQQLVQSLESINSQILQLKDSHVNMVEKSKQEQIIQSTQETSYNQGYTDAEKAYSSQMSGSPAELPDEVLQGINTLSDDELELLMTQNPDLMTLVNDSQGK